jgi:osmoprotectant transport system ATP-binding protein
VDNIATVPLLTGETRQAARAVELLEFVGLSTELSRRYPRSCPAASSSGVGVARALTANPPVLLMDEPFSAVDPVVREDCRTSCCGCRVSWANHPARHPRHRRGGQAR